MRLERIGNCVYERLSAAWISGKKQQILHFPLKEKMVISKVLEPL